MELTRLFDALARAGLPGLTRYLVIDLETSGLSVRHDRVTQVGHLLVDEDGPVDGGAFLLDWSSLLDPLDQERLRRRLGDTARRLGHLGKAFHTPWRRLCDEGADPRAVLAGYADLIRTAVAAGYGVVTHNGLGFDLPFLRRAWEETGVRPPSGGLLADTGAILKAARTGALPHPGEPSLLFFRRVLAGRAAGVRWSLSDYAAPLFGLPVDPAAAHDAGYDCRLTHLLYDAMHRHAREGRPLPAGGTLSEDEHVDKRGRRRAG